MGMGSGAPGCTGTALATARAAVKAYVDGWSSTLGADSGVYGSSAGSYANDWATIAHPPAEVWLAAWGSPAANPNTVWNLPGVPNGHWAMDQRVHPEGVSSTTPLWATSNRRPAATMSTASTHGWIKESHGTTMATSRTKPTRSTPRPCVWGRINEPIHLASTIPDCRHLVPVRGHRVRRRARAGARPEWES